MSQAVVRDSSKPPVQPSTVDTMHLGRTLRSLYEDSVDRQPLPDAQVDLLLRLRHRERELRRAG